MCCGVHALRLEQSIWNTPQRNDFSIFILIVLHFAVPRQNVKSLVRNYVQRITKSLAFLIHSIRNINPIPLPCFSFVRRKCLTPNRMLPVTHVPTKQNNNILAVEDVLTEEMSNVIIK